MKGFQFPTIRKTVIFCTLNILSVRYNVKLLLEYVVKLGNRKSKNHKVWTSLTSPNISKFDYLNMSLLTN